MKFGYFMAGAGMGVIAGLLFAPRSGEEMRKLIRERAEEGGEYLKTKAHELGDRAGEIVEKGKEWAERGRESAQTAFEAGKQAYKQEKH
ncbi:MAG: YtxH domain-containing protein [Pseudomonadota bacterium]